MSIQRYEFGKDGIEYFHPFGDWVKNKTTKQRSHV